MLDPAAPLPMTAEGRLLRAVAVTQAETARLSRQAASPRIKLAATVVPATTEPGSLAYFGNELVVADGESLVLPDGAIAQVSAVAAGKLNYSGSPGDENTGFVYAQWRRVGFLSWSHPATLTVWTAFSATDAPATAPRTRIFPEPGQTNSFGVLTASGVYPAEYPIGGDPEQGGLSDRFGGWATLPEVPTGEEVEWRLVARSFGTGTFRLDRAALLVGAT